MITAKNWEELQVFPKCIQDYARRLAEEDTFSANKIEEWDFLRDLGGEFILIENYDELSKIIVLSDKDDRDYATIIEEPGGIDVAEWIDDYAHLCLITNNAGGTSFIIPKIIADMCPNIALVIDNANNS